MSLLYKLWKVVISSFECRRERLASFRVCHQQQFVTVPLLFTEQIEPSPSSIVECRFPFMYTTNFARDKKGKISRNPGGLNDLLYPVHFPLLLRKKEMCVCCWGLERSEGYRIVYIYFSLRLQYIYIVAFVVVVALRRWRCYRMIFSPADSGSITRSYIDCNQLDRRRMESEKRGRHLLLLLLYLLQASSDHLARGIKVCWKCI